MARLIDADALAMEIAKAKRCIQSKNSDYLTGYVSALSGVEGQIAYQPTVEVVHGQRLYNAHEVAEIIAELFGDCCACNFNGIDEWLPLKCELQDACPFPVGVACWEQYLKYRSAKMDGDGNV